MKSRLLFGFCSVVAFEVGAVGGRSLSEFSRLPGEADDAPRFQRAVDACPCGTLLVPHGKYEFAQTVFVTNCCSIEMCPSARITAVAKMDWMIRINAIWQYDKNKAPKGVDSSMYNLTYRGGTLDARGMASCLSVDNYRHYALEDAAFLNPKKYGVGIELEGGGFEMFARNLYCRTEMRGLSGNTGIFTNGGDSHYCDCVVIDCTTGFHLAKRSSNRLSRIHVWGGALPPRRSGEISEGLVGSVSFRIEASDTLLRDCYSDTSEIGFYVTGWETRMFGCTAANFPRHNISHATVICQPKGSLLLTGFIATKGSKTAKAYDAGPEAKICARDNIYRGSFKEDEGPFPGRMVFCEPMSNPDFKDPFQKP